MAKRTRTIFEYDVLVEEGGGKLVGSGEMAVPPPVFDWLSQQCLIQSEEKAARWARLGQRGGRAVVQVTNYVGVIRAPDGFQIEVLPKVGRMGADQESWARGLLIRMLSCLGPFRHLRTARAEIATTKMPLLEIFVAEFLEAVYSIVKRGLRGAYVTRQENLPYLRGKLMLADHLRTNLVRADSFFTEHSEFSTDRAENRLIHAALNEVIALSASIDNQRRARELRFVFSDVAPSAHVAADLRQVQPERSTAHYAEALAGAELILTGCSPLTGAGTKSATSLLFPMEILFEAYVAKHLRFELDSSHRLKAHPATGHLVEHEAERWFRLEPDLLVRQGRRNVVVLDTKWKLLNIHPSARKDKYNLSQSDFYQLHAYGQAYLEGEGDVVLIYPKTETFSRPLEPFFFSNARRLRLWVLPFCLDTRRLMVPRGNAEKSAFPKILRTQGPPALQI